MKRIVSLCAALLLTAACLAGCGEPIPRRLPDELLYEIITDYGSSQGGTKNSRALMEELQTADNQRAERWQDILDYWNYVNTEMPVNSGKLPDDLPDDDSLCIVVLGYQLNADGSMQNELIGRLKTALACSEQYPNAYVLCTGGGTAAMDSTATEADKMGKWLLKKGLSKKRLILENRSLTTAQNAEFSFDILRSKYPQVRSAAIVTSRYHIPWGSLMFGTVFRMNAEDHESLPVEIVSNCAYEIDRAGFTQSNNLRCEAAGMEELLSYEIGMNQQ